MKIVTPGKFFVLPELEQRTAFFKGFQASDGNTNKIRLAGLLPPNG